MTPGKSSRRLPSRLRIAGSIRWSRRRPSVGTGRMTGIGWRMRSCRLSVMVTGHPSSSSSGALASRVRSLPMGSLTARPCRSCARIDPWFWWTIGLSDCRSLLSGATILAPRAFWPAQAPSLTLGLHPRTCAAPRSLTISMRSLSYATGPMWRWSELHTVPALRPRSCVIILSALAPLFSTVSSRSRSTGSAMGLRHRLPQGIRPLALPRS